MSDTRTIIEHVKMGDSSVEVRFDYDYATENGQVRILPDTSAPVNVPFITADQGEVERLGRVLIMLSQMTGLDWDAIDEATQRSEA